MTAGGRTHDADAFWIHLPFVGARANESQGTRSVLQHARVPIAVWTEPIFEHESSDALFIQPQRIILAFVGRESGIAAAGANDHRSAARLGGIGGIRRK